ncbi:MAG TPA: helix-turn-helix domain-containing protein [Luteolibacter sp.]|nr:helix-turn-helix domain-containing protein [Luteolibacter sp.]
MPRIIRKALYLKLKQLPELREFQRDFEKLSGMRLSLVDELGLGDEDSCANSPICAVMLASPEGRVMCARLRQGLLSRATGQPACAVCDAGLQEAAVPLRVSGIPAGYFIFGGVLRQATNPPSVRRARHLLRHHGIQMDEEPLRLLLERSPVMGSEVLQACQRIAHLAARQLALKVTDQLVDAEGTLPPAVLKACGHIRARALTEDLNLKSVARACGVSEGHLSRLFHHATGLTFREYLTQVRVEHAKALILQSGRGITEIAYESGFQSLSQFHRVFRKVYGTKPGRLRASRANHS